MKRTKLLSLFLFVLTCTFGYAEEAKPLSWYEPYLRVQEVQDNGHLLILDDGSEWNIEYFGGLWRLVGWGMFEQKEVSHWAVGDVIEIGYSSAGNILDFLLEISNLSKKEWAVASFKAPPSTDNPSCLWVVNVNEKNQQVTLSNGSVWLKTKYDFYGAAIDYKDSIKSPWQPGDPVTFLRDQSFFNGTWYYIWNHAVNQLPIVEALD